VVQAYHRIFDPLSDGFKRFHHLVVTSPGVLLALTRLLVGRPQTTEFPFFPFLFRDPGFQENNKRSALLINGVLFSQTFQKPGGLGIHFAGHFAARKPPAPFRRQPAHREQEDCQKTSSSLFNKSLLRRSVI
jgi:hypothetical protein